MHRPIFRIALPSIISNITVPLLTWVDTAITGHLGSVVPLAAIAIGGTLFSTIYWLFNFLRISTGGLTAQSYGAQSWNDCAAHLSRSLGIALLIGFLLLLLQSPLLNLGLWLLQPTAEVASLASTYFHILIWGTLPTLLLSALNGWLLGMQDARAPMYVSLVQNVSNILLSLAFVYGLGWGLRGVAYGTLLAQWLGAILALWFTLHRLRQKSISPSLRLALQSNFAPWQRLFALNRDIFLRTLCLVSVMFAFNALGSRLGSNTLAINALLLQFFLLISHVMDGFAYAGEALGGRFCGEGTRASFLRLSRTLFLWGAGLSSIFALSFALGGHCVLSLMTNVSSILEQSKAYLPWLSLLPLVSFSAFLLDGLYIGLTATRSMLVGVASAAALFFITVLCFLPLWGNHALWLAFLIYLGSRGAVQALFFPKLIDRHFPILPNSPSESNPPN